ncbi:hypothetical protein [Clostridium sp.]|jgi:hypothetical protein|uniref:hypothetical protein n=1 Tax=Clostridium sp. TaxID=1506 RepID=UPI003EED7632
MDGIILLVILLPFLSLISMIFMIIHKLKLPYMKILGPFIDTKSITIIAALVCICSGGVAFLLNQNTTSLTLIVILGMGLLVSLGICLIILNKIGMAE